MIDNDCLSEDISLWGLVGYMYIVFIRSYIISYNLNYVIYQIFVLILINLIIIMFSSMYLKYESSINFYPLWK